MNRYYIPDVEKEDARDNNFKYLDKKARKKFFKAIKKDKLYVFFFSFPTRTSSVESQNSTNGSPEKAIPKTRNIFPRKCSSLNV